MSKAPMRTVDHVDLPRYMGDWYVIANIPYFAEKNCFDSIESYALRADGRIDNRFRCRKGSFEAPLERKATAVARVEDTTSNARMGVWHRRARLPLWRAHGGLPRAHAVAPVPGHGYCTDRAAFTRRPWRGLSGVSARHEPLRALVSQARSALRQRRVIE